MTAAEIRYVAETEELVLQTGQRIRGDDVGSFAAPMAVVRGLKAVALKRALAAASKNHWGDPERLSISADQPEHFDPDTSPRTLADFVLARGELLVRCHVFFGEEPQRDRVLAASRRHLARRSAEVRSLKLDQVKDEWHGTLDLRPHLHGQTLEELHALGEELSTLLMTSAAYGELDRDAIKAVLDAGLSEALVGQLEGDWLDVKRAPYRLDQEDQEFELAKDVAALANAGGGLIVIGMKTRKRGEGDVFAEVNGCRLEDVSRQRYRGVVSRKVFPEIVGLEVVKVAGSSPNPDIVYVYVPRQNAASKPFLVQGAVVAKRFKAAFVSVPMRQGEHTGYLDIATMHARLRAGQQALGRSDNDSVAGRIASLEADCGGYRDIAVAATRQGFRVNATQRDISFTSPSGEVVTAPLGSADIAQPLHRQELLKQLSRMGLRTRTTPRGFLIPEEA
jgi:hypothetical protein